MIQRYYLEDEEPSELEQICINASVAALLAAGWTFTDDTRILEGPDGERRWFSFGFEELPIREPEVGTLVAAFDEGTVRQGPVEHRGPGFFSFRYAYKSGRGGSSKTVMTRHDVSGRDRWQVVDPPSKVLAAMLDASEEKP